MSLRTQWQTARIKRHQEVLERKQSVTEFLEKTRSQQQEVWQQEDRKRAAYVIWIKEYVWGKTTTPQGAAAKSTARTDKKTAASTTTTTARDAAQKKTATTPQGAAAKSTAKTDKKAAASTTPTADQTSTEPLPPQQSVLNLKGKGSHVIIPFKEPAAEVTNELWFKTDAPNCGLFSAIYTTDVETGHVCSLYLKGGNISTRIGNNGVISSSDLNLADNTWHHVAHVFGSSIGGQKIYIDGQMVASGSKGTADFTSNGMLAIGRTADAAAQFCKGQIADVRVWNMVRSPTAIQAEMSYRLVGDETHLIGYWPLNEGSGEVATDKTENNHQGTIHNGTWDTAVQ